MCAGRCTPRGPKFLVFITFFFCVLSPALSLPLLSTHSFSNARRKAERGERDQQQQTPLVSNRSRHSLLLLLPNLSGISRKPPLGHS